MNNKYRLWLYLSLSVIAWSLFLHQQEIASGAQTTTKLQKVMVAVIDTGMELNHPMFKGKITKGVNLFDYSELPRDDHGHGTNVAGVLISTYEKHKRKLQNPADLMVMPIKALTSEGDGTESKLAEGIRYALEKNADLIVLSLGLNEDDPSLKKAVEDAEKKGVIVISATGNDGREVKYPAAYPTVLAVGGMDRKNQVATKSNNGLHVDVVTSWKVTTAGLNNRKEEVEGTSMAAPQVAAAAALYLNRQPKATPLQVRQFIRQTAQDIHEPGWDEKSGYGALQIDKILTQKAKPDIYEPNQNRQEAKVLPLDSIISAQRNGPDDKDWFFLNAPHNGTVTLSLLQIEANTKSLKVNVYKRNQAKPVRSLTVTASEATELEVTKGETWLEWSSAEVSKKPFEYTIATKFKMSEDDFEDNDRSFKAFVLPTRNQTLTASLGHPEDQDWYVYRANKAGKLNITVTPRHSHLDPVLKIKRNSEKFTTIDREEFDGTEMLRSFPIQKGTYYIMISNASGAAVNGEYELKLDFTGSTAQSLEPNNKPSQATKIKTDLSYNSQLSNGNQVDYYQLNTTGQQLLRLSLSPTRAAEEIEVSLYGKQMRMIPWNQSRSDGQTYMYIHPLEKGSFFLKLAQPDKDRETPYRISISLRPLLAGYSDISQHWAQPAIVQMTNQNLIDGYSDFRFEPNRNITRAEAVSVLVRAFKLTQKQNITFKDVKKNHWAYDEVAIAKKAGLISVDRTQLFRPDDSMTRAEMSVMVAAALKLKKTAVRTRPYRDVPPTHFAAGAVTELKKRQLINGFSDGRFNPQLQTTRAQFVHLLHRILKARNESI